MNIVENTDRPVEIHFPTGSPYSCGDTIDKPQSDDVMWVTCRTCLCEYSWQTDAYYTGRER